jgi:replicative DNA helicase
VDTQEACLSKIVLEADLTPFIDARITGKFFPDPKHRKIWDMVMDHFKKYGKPPDETVIHKAYPTYTFTKYIEPTVFYLQQLQQDRKKEILTKYVQSYIDRINEEEGPTIGDELESILRHGMTQAAHEISQGRDTDFYPSGSLVKAKIQERVLMEGKLRGISTGFHGMDHLTSGLQPEQLICVVGTAKAGKSSMLLKMAFNAHRHGSRVLFVTFEMSISEQEDRLVSLLTGIGLSKILNGNLDAPEQQAVNKVLDLRESMEGLILSSDIDGAITISGIQAKIQQYAPDLVLIDGLYLMDDETGHDKGSPQALTALTRSFKRLAQTARKPIVITTQAMDYRSKGGLNIGSIGYSSSFAQDSDIVFGVEPHKDLDKVSKFHVLASRSTPRGHVHFRFDWSQGMVEEMDDIEYEQALNNLPPASTTLGKKKNKGGYGRS